MHPNSKLLFNKYAKPLFGSHMKVLEIGPNSFPSTYKQLVENDSIKWETLDIYDSDSLTYIAENEYNFPVPNDTFDIVFSGQVIEHVKKIWLWIKELSRVCKVGGYVITINPVSWPYHEVPVDCWRIYPEGMKALYDEAGLTCQLSKAETLEVDLSHYIIPGDVGLRKYSDYEFPVATPAHSRRKQFKSLVKRLIGRPVIVPGVSYEPGYRNLIKRALGLPTPCSIDTITIGVKN